MSGPEEPPVVVLAHAAWADGSSWNKMIAGHAYAGAVIASTSNEKVATLVYVTALAPDEGETAGDVYYWAEHHPEAPALGPDSHGLIWLPEEAFGKAFAQDASPLEQALLAATQRPIAAACISVPVGRMKARVRSAAADHVPMITKASAVVDVLLEAVREVESNRMIKESSHG